MQTVEPSLGENTANQDIRAHASPSDAPTHGIWWRTLGAGLLLAGLAVVVPRLFEKPLYEATALLVIEDRPPFIAFPSETTGRDTDRYAQTQMELIRSRIVLEPALSKAALGELMELRMIASPLEHLQERLELLPKGDSEVYVLRYRGESPQSASTIVNTVAEQYMIYHANDDARRTQQIVDILEEERRRRMIEVERLRGRVVALAVEAGQDPQFRRDVGETGRGTSGGESADLRARVLEVDSDIAELKGEIAYLKRAGDANSEESNSTKSELDQRALVAGRQKLAGLIARRKFLSTERSKAAAAREGRSNEVEREFARAELERAENVFERIANRKLALQTEMRAPARVYLLQSAEKSVEALPTPVSGWTMGIAAIAFVMPFAVVGFLKWC